MIENKARGELTLGVLGDVFCYSRRSEVPPESKNIGLIWLTVLPYLYRSAARVNRHDFAETKAFGTFARCYTLISRGDDYLDQGEGTTFDNLKSDPINKRLLAEITDLVHQTPTASEEAKEQYLDEFERFLEEEYQLYKQFKLTGNLNDLSAVKEYKESTCGLNARMGARMFRLFVPHIDNQTALNAEEFIVSALMYCQVWDDVGDFLIDKESKTPNYLAAALHMYPDEERYLSNEAENGVTEIFKLRLAAPRSFEEIDLIAQGYLTAIPENLSKLGGQVALAKNTLGGKLTKFNFQK